jgi:uncharacterized damage-inducible protein DinB
MVDELSDERRHDPPFVADERSMLEAWLDWHRITLQLKCEGLSDDDRKRRPVETSKLSLHGLVRHMADVERNWFRRVLLDEQEVEPVFWRPGGDDDSELVPLDDAVWADDLAAWEAECEAARATAARFDLDHCGVRRGEPCSLRWIYNHMIEEYARHNGHADLLRELVDGAVGD